MKGSGGGGDGDRSGISVGPGPLDRQAGGWIVYLSSALTLPGVYFKEEVRDMSCDEGDGGGGGGGDGNGGGGDSSGIPDGPGLQEVG